MSSGFEQDRSALERLGTAGWHEELDAGDDERAEKRDRAGAVTPT
jgi:hypothetical protein